jgi:tetratricopeptide (TPR) repeat protein
MNLRWFSCNRKSKKRESILISHQRALQHLLKAKEILDAPGPQSINPDSDVYISVHNNLGHLYRRFEDYDRALYYFEQVLRYSPFSVSVLTSIGFIWHLKNDFKKAINYYHQVRSITLLNSGVVYSIRFFGWY